MNELFVSLYILLIPGIFAVILYDKIASHSAWNNFKYIWYAAFFGTLSYATLQPLLWGYSLLKCQSFEILSVWSAVSSGKLEGVNAIELVLATCVALVWVLIVAKKGYSGYIEKWANKTSISGKVSNRDLLTIFVNEREPGYTLVRVANSNVVYVGIMHLSNADENYIELQIENVSVYQEQYQQLSKGRVWRRLILLYKTDVVYLSGRKGELAIEKDYRPDDVPYDNPYEFNLKS